jgi:hypothetical protein
MMKASIMTRKLSLSATPERVRGGDKHAHLVEYEYAAMT